MPIDFLTQKFKRHVNEDAVIWKDQNYSYDWLAKKIEYCDTLIAENNLKFDEDVPNRADYSNIFNKFSNNIIDGTINKAILSRTKEFSIENKAILKNTHSPCTTFYIDLLDSKRFFGSTPEILISVNNKTYHSMHRSITQISNGNHGIRNDIREISTYCIRNRDVNNK